MASIANLQIRMYLTLAAVFAVGFALVYAALLWLGVGSSYIMVFSLLFFVLQWYMSPMLMQFMGRLRYIGADEYPKLHKLVGMLARHAGVPEPRIAISQRKDPNAYVFGRTRNSATLAVHEGLLSMLDDDEMEAVLAHEIGHLKHNDVTVMTMVSFLPMLAYMLAQNFFFGGMSGRGNGSRNGGGSLVLVGVAAFVVYMALQLITLSLSRLRETYADEYSALITRKPEQLASSLLKITSSNAISAARGAAQGGIARSFCIVDSHGAAQDVGEIMAHAEELKRLLPSINVERLAEEASGGGHGAAGLLGGMFTTHPPAYRRVLFLAKLKYEMKL